MDPFKLFKSYDDYSKNLIVIPNRDFISTEVYKKNRKVYHYDSFIFGSSRTMAYKTSDWRKYLGPSSSPFIFDASGESIFGIYTKVKFIDKLKDTIKNALVILCPDCTFACDTDQKGHLFMKDPSAAGTSWIKFYTEFFKVYLDWGFLRNYYDYILTKNFKPSMSDFLEYRKIKYDPITNDVWVLDWENELRDNQVLYYRNRKSTFYYRGPTEISLNPQISERQKEMLLVIKKIFDKYKTSYKILISPLYKQQKFNTTDLEILNGIFGKKNVFDFSGKNQITDNIKNYYENSHYRIHVGDSIMSIIYK
jgi:hypothetical protein